MFIYIEVNCIHIWAAQAQGDLSMELIRGGIFEAKHSLPDGYGWSKLVKSLKMHRADGTHSTILAKPNMRRVQRLFSEIVEPNA